MVMEICGKIEEMITKYYSVVLNHVINEDYALILSKWELDEEGKKINNESLVLSGISLPTALEKIKEWTGIQ